MNIGNKVLKQFIKDYKLPIQVFQQPFFDYYAELYDSEFKVKEKLTMLEKTLSCFENEEKFLEANHLISKKIISTIEQSEAFKRFNSMKMDCFDVPKNNYGKKDVFNSVNVGKCFVSIDLKKANFQALNYVDENILLNNKTYEDLILSFTTPQIYEYFKGSKSLRQVMFGQLNPKRHTKVERYMIQKILDFMKEQMNLKDSIIKVVSHDEIVFEIELISEMEAVNLSINIENKIKECLNFNVDVEIYVLNNISNFKSYFVKNFLSKKGHELMCIPGNYYAQVFKKYHNMPLHEYDLLFYYEKQLCKFLEPLKEDDNKNEMEGV